MASPKAGPKSRQPREVGAEGFYSSRLKLKRLPSLEDIPLGSALDSVSEEGDRDTDLDASVDSDP